MSEKERPRHVQQRGTVTHRRLVKLAWPTWYTSEPGALAEVLSLPGNEETFRTMRPLPIGIVAPAADAPKVQGAEVAVATV